MLPAMSHPTTPLPQRQRASIEPGQDRLVFSDSSILHGQPPIVRTRAQLSLEQNLQGSNVRSSGAANPSAGTAAGPAQVSSHKFRSSKPRLLLMGLRRWVQPVSVLEKRRTRL